MYYFQIQIFIHLSKFKQEIVVKKKKKITSNCR